MKDRVARAREIIADLKAAGGWDLSGWEYHFADEAENYVAPLAEIPALGEGEGAFKVDGEWRRVHITRIAISDHQDTLEFVSSSGIHHREIAGPRERTIEMTCGISDTAMDVAQRLGEVEVAVGLAGDGVMTQKVIVTKYEVEFPFHGNPTTIEITMMATL